MRVEGRISVRFLETKDAAKAASDLAFALRDVFGSEFEVVAVDLVQVEERTEAG